MTPVCFYIDGFNLYHALVKFRDDKVKWLDLAALAKRLILPATETITGIYYFSAFADWLPGPMSRHERYVSALGATGVDCYMGHFKVKDRHCKACGSSWQAHEEKETDVSIGIHLLNDAYKGQYEKAYLVTRDSDLMPAVRMVRDEFPKKEIVAVAPPLMGHSNDLIQVCQLKKKITPKQIRACLLPQHIRDASGQVIVTRPVEYD
ncbi:NYN domain-containing protein [Bradyrhizobium oligotrophicum]|uniref:NYN domain-containing protein n=1 Tax=Bradyrhizobium oligotrophicum TaxID=44255 RepID=UPI003EB88995